ncbi:AraC family transcriptional regulator [Serratia fonticola]|uniref:AraC family transcriptional regulator n=1 Tax=Serratia fonticola TaxID=47917 RepID=UPI0027EA4A6F|nr:AraC family transcriptional regulator [Serratia fonticola]MDQ7212653.1 AraC family transcriptional regulator [Serratia fonticola]HBE9082877.1 helix-turn-helix domain-containing protein [Serratia fonticola]HBE9092979.1 helix-turn-helix domain-containing protein [Serratia fonticola]HBE9153555.1 helix-turn-helix domain-containing protein [Serratia fonticola]
MDETTDYDALVIERVLDRVVAEENLPHSHPLGQFVLVNHGVLYGHTPEQHWLLKPGMAVWIPPNTIHWGRAYNRVDLTVFYITPELCYAPTSQIKLLDSSLLIVALCERLAAAKQPLTEARRNSMLQMLFEEIEEQPDSNLSLPLPKDSRLKKVTCSLIDNPAQRRSLSEWGCLVGATERTLARLFLKETGMRYTEWHNRLLLAVAWQGLAKGLSNGQISAMLGFSSGDSFGHWFRRVAANCPGRVRKCLQDYPLRKID